VEVKLSEEEADKLFREMIADKQREAYVKEVIDFLDTHPKEYALLRVISKTLLKSFLEDIEIQRSNPYLHEGDEVIIEKHRHVMYNIAAFVYAMKKFREKEEKE